MQPEGYSLITCMHLFEHVGSPRSFLIDALRFLAHGGLIYIEVPLELKESDREDFEHRIINNAFLIHEQV